MTPPPQGRVLAILFIGVLMGALDLAIIGPALPAIQAEFGVDGRALAWIFNIYVLFQLIGTPLMAKLSDRYGRRSIYIANLTLFGAGSLVMVIAPNLSVLLFGRALQGLGAGGIFPVASAVIGDTFPPEKRGPTLGLLGAVFGIAFLVGPVLGGIFLRWSWHWLFLINLPICALLIWQAWRLLPHATGAPRKPLDTAGAVTLSLLLACLAAAFTQVDSSQLPTSLANWNVAPFLLAIPLLAMLFWRIEKQAADPVVRPGLLSSRQVRLTMAIAAGTGAVEAGSAFFPKLAVIALGVSDYNASLLMLPSVLATTIGAPIVGKLLNRYGARLIVQLGLAAVCAGALVYALAELTVPVFIAGGVIGGLGFAALLGAPLRYIVLNEADASERAAAQGLLTVFLSTGLLVGAALVGGIAASRGDVTGGYQLAFLMLALISGALALAGFGLKSRSEELATARPG